MDDLITEFADQMGVDPEMIENRWAGRPDKIAEDIFRVKDLDTGEIRDLELFRPYQPKIMHAYFYGEASTLNIYKGRRIGVSYIICLAILLDGILNPGTFYPIVSRKEAQAQSRISDISELIELSKIDIPTKKDISGEIELWNGSRFKAYTGSPSGARGDDSAKTVFIDEMAFLEDQDATSRAFSPFVSLGSRGMMVEVSTPEAKNDLFMNNHARGTESGFDESGERIGTISIKQPTFKNADEIDVEIPLDEQEAVPVRPDLNIEKVEEDRLKDPQGFAQEYLCRPIDESYRFFSESSIRTSMEQSQSAEYAYGMYSPKQAGTNRMMAVDIGIDSDDTVISVTDRLADSRDQRFIEVVDNDVLREAGIENPDRGNAVHIAHRIAQVFSQMDCDYIVIDKTGPGETFQRIIEEKLGRQVVGFNFSDKDSVKKMMEDMNTGLRQGDVTLVKDADLFDQMTSIVKVQKEDWQKPKYSGKDHAESGKDDMAMATVMSAYPPGLSTIPATQPADKPATQPDYEPDKISSDPPPPSGAERTANETVPTGAFASRQSRRTTGRRQYKSKYPRRRSRY